MITSTPPPGPMISTLPRPPQLVRERLDAVPQRRVPLGSVASVAVDQVAASESMKMQLAVRVVGLDVTVTRENEFQRENSTPSR